MNIRKFEAPLAVAACLVSVISCLTVAFHLASSSRPPADNLTRDDLEYGWTENYQYKTPLTYLPETPDDEESWRLWEKAHLGSFSDGPKTAPARGR